MSSVGVLLLSLSLSFLGPFTGDIEKAFLQNDPDLLRALFAPGSVLSLSLPDPINFSDQLSEEQAYLLFRRLFSAYRTFGFYPERDVLRSLDGGVFILKARWEFFTPSRTQKALNVLFLVRGRPDGPGLRGFWRIIQIKAERL